MRIAICGSHWVGKTTISKIISEKFNLKVLPDIVVDAHKMWLEINENTPMETQIRLLAKQFENEFIHKDFVADKCIFDYHIYAKALDMDEHVVLITKKLALKSHNYDIIFYIKPEFALVDDGLRSLNPEFQSAVHNVYEDFLSENNINYHILSWSIEDREQQVLDIIKNHKW